MTFQTTRREFLTAAGTAAAAGALSSAIAPSLHAAEKTPLGKAEHCIMLWLGGGAGQMDTFDPKPKGDPKAEKPG